jgi:hypothetical protein
MPSERKDLVIKECNESVQLVRCASSDEVTDFNALVNTYTSFLMKLNIPVNDLNFPQKNNL